MTRRYLLLAIVAFVAYSLVPPFLKVAMETIPSTMAVFLSNTVMLVIIGAVLAYKGRSPLKYVRHPTAPLIAAWGVLLAIGLLSYYRALALGPVSVVVPIYGLFIVVSSVIGIVILGESVTRRKVASIFFAVIAILLMAL